MRAAEIIVLPTPVSVPVIKKPLAKNPPYTVFSTSINRSISSSVCAAVIVILILGSFTVGGRIAGAKMPFLRRRSEMRRVFSMLPVLMGTMGVSDPMVSYPRLVMPFASFFLFSQSFFKTFRIISHQVQRSKGCCNNTARQCC